MCQINGFTAGYVRSTKLIATITKKVLVLSNNGTVRIRHFSRY